MAQLPYIVSVVALLFSVYQFIKNTEKEDTGQITTVLVKLENIAELVAEIRKDVRDDRDERKELRDRLVAVESSTKSAHKRIDTLEKHVHGQIPTEQ